MPTDFSQWLTFFLIALLFGKDNLLPAIMKKLGLANSHSEKTSTDQLAAALKKALVDDGHSPIIVKARIQRICDDVAQMKADISFIKGKLDK